MQSILVPKINLLNRYLCQLQILTAGRNLKLEYLPEDSLEQPHYVPLPAGRIFTCKNYVQAESLSAKTACRQNI